MTEKTQIFYYSRHKLGMYLLFNLGLLALAILFTWSIFPDYQPVYYFALGTCSVSILSSFFVFLVRLPLAIITDQSIRIDHNQPLLWSQVKGIEKTETQYLGFSRPILKLIPKNIKNYKMGFMQKLIGNSQYGAFSIPLYAMSSKNAKQIEKAILKHLSSKKQPSKVVAKKTSKKTTLTK